MEPLLRQVRELPTRVAGMPSRGRIVLAVLALLVLAVVGGVTWLMGAADSYQYAFTNLSPEDSAEAAALLKTSQMPFRMEAGGAALAVPSSKVYEARLLLAASGLPRGGGVGFELFDRGDLGVSEFTQRVNLRRAIEGELARTIGKLSEVRSARVHLSLGEKGLYRDEDRSASAAVVLNLQPGRTLADKSLAGIRHLVASAVPGLNAEAVTVVDGKGAVLTTEGDDPSLGYTHKLEHDLETRLVSVLEPVVGSGAVVAKVTAAVNDSDVNSTSEVYDGENPALRSERRTVQNQAQESGANGGVAGAAANQPLTPPVTTDARTGQRGNSNSQDEVRNYELTKTTTQTHAHSPRLERLSIAVVVDGVNGKPRDDAELARLVELAKGAIGFDEERGDKLHVSSAVFTHSSEPAGTEPPKATLPLGLPLPVLIGIGGGVLLLAIIAAAFFLLRRPRPAHEVLQLKPGMKVADIEAMALPALPATASQRPTADPSAALQERARQIAVKDPVRAVHLIRAWMSTEGERKETSLG